MPPIPPMRKGLTEPFRRGAPVSPPPAGVNVYTWERGSVEVEVEEEVEMEGR